MLNFHVGFGVEDVSVVSQFFHCCQQVRRVIVKTLNLFFLLKNNNNKLSTRVKME